MAAPFSATASMVRSMVAASISGRTASWTSTISSGFGGQDVERVGHRFLALFAALHHVHAAGKTVLGNLRLDALHLRLAHGHVNRRDARRRGKGAQRVNEDGHAIEREKLLGLRMRDPPCGCPVPRREE